MNTSGSLSSVGNTTDRAPDINTCSTEFHESVQTSSDALLIALCVVNIIGSLIATTSNFLVMWAIKAAPSMHTPSGILLFLLASSDFVVGIFAQPLLVIKLVSRLTAAHVLYCITTPLLYPVASTVAMVSFITVTAITFDRYLALALHLRYAAIITVNRVIKFIMVLCGFPIPPLLMCFWFSTETWFRLAALGVGFVLAAVCIVMIIFSYFRIFSILRRHKKQIQNQDNLASARLSHVNLSKYRKSVFTILYVFGTLVLCYLPSAASFVIHLTSVTEISVFLLGITGTTVLLNSSVNPVLYCCRVKEIRRFVMVKLRCMVGASGETKNSVVCARWQVRPINDLR